MIQKVVRKLDLSYTSSEKNGLAYWLSETPEERVPIVECSWEKVVLPVPSKGWRAFTACVRT